MTIAERADAICAQMPESVRMCLEGDIEEALREARAEGYCEGVEAAAKVADGIFDAMPPNTIFPVTKGIVNRIAAGIRALMPVPS